MRLASALAVVAATVLVGPEIRAQLVFGDPATVIPPPNSVNICEPQPDGVFLVNWKTTEAITDGQFTIPVPAGIAYLSGSIALTNEVNVPTGYDFSGGQLGPNVVLRLRDPLPAGASGTFEFKLTYDCQVQSIFTSSYQLDVTAESAGGTYSARTEAINTSSAAPYVIPAATASSDLTDVVVNTSYTRSFEIVQTGKLAEAFAFELCVDHGADVSSSNPVIIAGAVTEPITFAPGDPCVTITQATHPTLPWPMAQDDAWVYQEDVVVTGCEDLETAVSTAFGCSGVNCQDPALLPLVIELDDDGPSVTSSSQSNVLPPDGCIDDGNEITVRYTLTGRAYETYFILEARNTRTYVDQSSIEIDYGTGTFTPYTGGFSSLQNASGCASGEYRRMTLDRLSTPIDATGGPLNIRIRYKTKLCCSSTIGNNNRTDEVYGGITRFFYFDKCGTLRKSERWSRRYNLGANGAANVPGYIADGATEEFRFELTSFAVDAALRPNARYCFAFSVDPMLDLDIPAGVRWVGAPADPVHSATITDLGGGNYEACFGVGEFHESGSYIVFDAGYTCSAAKCGQSATTTGRLDVELGGGLCPPGGDCGFALFDKSASTSLGRDCCVTGCEGLYNQSATIERTCFGAPDDDNDGAPNAGTVDLTRVALNRALPGDNLRFDTRAIVNTSGAGFANVGMALSANRDHVALGSATLVVTDFSTPAPMAAYTLTVAPTVIGPRDIEYRITAADVIASGAPATFVFENGDILELEGDLTTTENSGNCELAEVSIESDWFAKLAPFAPGATVNADRLSCNVPVPSSYLLVGWRYYVGDGYDQQRGCAGLQYRTSIELCIGGGNVGMRPFPYEVRNFGVPDISKAEIPPGMTFTEALVTRPEFTIAADNANQGGSKNVTAYATIEGDSVVFDYADFFANFTGGVLPTGGYKFAFEVRFEGSCESETTTPAYSFQAREDFCTLPQNLARTYRLRNNPAEVAKAELRLSSPTPFKEPINDTVSWNFSLRERGGTGATSHWIALASPSGGVAPLRLLRNGSVVPPNAAGFYELGPINGTQVENFVVEADYTNCDRDSLVVYSGWNCGSYPATRTEIVDGTFPCDQVRLPLFLEPLPAEIQSAITAQPTVDLDACGDLAYSVELLNVDNAVVYEPTFSVIGPSSEGIETIAESIRLAYPSPKNPTAADFDSIGTYDYVVATPNGPKYVWYLDNHVAEFDHTSRMGWEGQLSADSLARRITIRFQAETNCLFEPGDYLAFVGEGRTYCGDPTATSTRNANSVNPVNVDLPYDGFLLLDPPSDLDACNPAGTVTLTGSLQYERPTDGWDTLVFDLPGSVSYSSAVTPDAQLDFPNAVVQTLSGPSGDHERLLVPVLSGRPAYERMRFALDLAVNYDSTGCGRTDAISGFTTHTFGYACDTAYCESRDTTSTLAPTPVTFRLDTVSIAAFEVTADCDFTVLTVDRLAVTVDNATDATGTDLPFAVYVDTDGDGAYTPADRLLGSVTLPQNTPAGTTVDLAAGPYAISADEMCDLRVASDGCACQAVASAPTAVASENAGGDATACAPDPATVGCGVDNRPLGYAYAWTQVAGSGPAVTIDDPAAPQTTITPAAEILDGDETYTFELTTTGPSGCFSTVDRVDVTFTGVATAAGATIVRCTGFETTLDAPDDPSFTGGSWSPTAGLADPTDPNTGVTLQPGTTDYYYTYRLPSGCYARYHKQTQGEDCPDLELSKVVTAPPTVVGDPVTFVITLTNAGADMARGVTVRDLLDPAAFTFVSATPGGAYDAATGTWIPIGGNVPPGNTATLELVAATIDSGLLVNLAEVWTLDEDDPDSEPGNSIITEDDMDGACVGLPMRIACGEPVPALTAYPGYGSYQWQRDGVDVPGATSASFTPDTTGTYTVVLDGGTATVPTCPVDVYLEQCGDIADFVWQDDDADGRQDAGEPGIPGVTVRLYDDATGNVLGTAITDAAGAYRFERVPLGVYTVDFDATTATTPFAYNHSPQYATAPDTELDSDPSPITGRTDTVQVNYAGHVRDDVDAGFVPRDELDVDRFDITLDCDLTSVTVDRIDVRNLGAKPITDDLTVDVYHDANGNGIGDGTETVIGSFTLTDDIPVGEARSVGGLTFAVAPDEVCRLIAVAAGCVCDAAASPVTSLAGANAGPDDSGCAPDALGIGCSPDLRPAGVTFAWAAADPAAFGGAADALIADATAPQTTVAASADLYADATADYVLTTTLPGGCTLADTVTVAFAGINVRRGPDLSDCVAEPVALTGPAGFADYEWTPAAGLSDPTDPNATVAVATGTTEYRLRYTDAAGCTAEYRQTVVGEGCTDLALAKSIRGVTPTAVGQTVAFALEVTNEGLAEATGVAVAEVLDPALAFERAEPAGEYDPDAGRWTVPGAIAPGETRTLVVYATVVRAGIITNVAEVAAADQRDRDSEPANDLIAEDDMDALCFAVDHEVPCATPDAADGYTLRTYPGLADYQWLRDGAAVPGATAHTLTVTEPGVYSVVIEGGASLYPHDCAVDVAFERCTDVGDRVWLDADGDGIQGPGEPGLPGVAVDLLDAAAGDAALRTVRTDAEGRYRFADVPAGTYALRFAEGSDLVNAPLAFSPQNQGGDDDLDSDADPATGRTADFTVGPLDDERLDLDAGLHPDAELAVTKRVAGFENLRDGNLVIRLEVAVANTAAVDLDALTLADDLARHFGDALVAVHAPPRAFGGAGVRANPGFDGVNDTLLLDPATALPAGGELLVTFAVTVDPFAASWPLYNQATASGEARVGDGLPAFTATDLSDSGTEFDSTNPGEPGDRGTADDPTEIACAPLGNAVDHDADEVCLGEAVTLASRIRPDGYAYEWRGADVEAPDSLTEQLRVTPTAGPEYRTAPTAALTAYTLWVYNDGSPVCYYDTEADAEVAVVLPPQIITPNNDGANDELVIACLRDRPGAQLTVYNRWGSPVYHADDYRNDWDGTHLGKPLPVGTYFIVLVLPDEDATRGAKPYKGVLAIER